MNMNQEMQRVVCKEYRTMSKKLAAVIGEYVTEKPDALLCLAAGDTPTGVYAELTEMQNQDAVDFSRCRFIGLDEWVGLGLEDAGGCINYIYEHVFSPLRIKPEQIVFFDAKAPDLQAECRKMNEYLQENGPIDIALMGVGMNGHVGLNEPGSSFDGAAQVVNLDAMTKEVARKYFERPLPIERGITLGMGQILASERLLIMACQKKKAKIMQRAMEQEVTCMLPASGIQLHKHCTVFLDEDAAALLK